MQFYCFILEFQFLPNEEKGLFFGRCLDQIDNAQQVSHLMILSFTKLDVSLQINEDFPSLTCCGAEIVLIQYWCWYQYRKPRPLYGHNAQNIDTWKLKYIKIYPLTSAK